MAHQTIFNQLAQSTQKCLAVLIDPDSVTDKHALDKTLALCQANQVDFILVGGSLITNGFWNDCIAQIKSCTQIPVVLFPGNNMQIHQDADAILFLSLISGRNADLLIGKHVLAAPELKRTGIEVIPTGYLLIEGGSSSSVLYMSNTMPIPKNKSSIAATTAMAGEMLGLKTIYMDAGSGANWPVASDMIQAVRKAVQLPIFVGGGIRTPEQAVAACNAGANVVVVGNAFEQNPELIQRIAEAVHALNN